MKIFWFLKNRIILKAYYVYSEKKLHIYIYIYIDTGKIIWKHIMKIFWFLKNRIILKAYLFSLNKQIIIFLCKESRKKKQNMIFLIKNYQSQN